MNRSPAQKRGLRTQPTLGAVVRLRGSERVGKFRGDKEDTSLQRSIEEKKKITLNGFVNTLEN